jgi:probable F420-dependent oxidoreductase
MKFGIGLITGYEGLVYPIPFGTPRQLIEMVKKAEDLGYDSVWPNDHMTVQKYVAAKEKVSPNFYESIVTLAGAAGVTERIQLCTGLIPLPYREPLLLAKQAATLDQISGGRFVLGVGLGAYREEFNGVHPQWADVPRVKIVEEVLECLKLLFEEDIVSFSGEFFQFKDIRMYPKPFQKPLPIYIGGNSEKVLERVARHGNGWFPACLSPQAIKERLVRLNAYLGEKGRKLAEIDIAPQIFVGMGKNKEEATDTFQKSGLYEHVVSLKSSTLKGDDILNLDDFNIIGNPHDMIEKVKEYEAAGVTHLTGLLFAVDNIEDFYEQMELFAKTVIPAFRK